MVGSRTSRLALIQTELVVAEMKRVSPGTVFTVEKIVTHGDRDRQIPLDREEAAGIFIKELEEALLEKKIDIAIHSLKDVPERITAGLCLAATTERLEPGDVLVTRGLSLAQLPPGSRIGTDSLRRSIQLLRQRKDLEVHSLRGNVDTRVGKVVQGELDGIILAAAGLIRLGLQDRISQYLPIDDFLPAPGQGALAIEIRQDDCQVYQLVSQVNHLPTWQSVTAERALLTALGVDCDVPIAALGRVTDGWLTLTGMVASRDGNVLLQRKAEGDAREAGRVGERLARMMLESGASELIAGLRRK